MALATTCPQCKTSFKVVPDQLKLRKGLVRCGKCQHVFSGIDYISHVTPPVIQAVPPPQPPEVIKASKKLDLASSNDEALNTAFFIPDTVLAPTTQMMTEAFENRISRDQSRTSKEPARPPSSIKLHKDDNADKSQRSGNAKSSLFAQKEVTNTDEPEAINFFSNTDDRGGFRGFSNRTDVYLLLMGIVLSVVLLGQILIGARDSIATKLTGAAPAVEMLSDLFGLKTQAPRQLDSLTIESFELQASAVSGVFAMNALLKNAAPHAVRWPAIELSLTDATGNSLLKKVLLPTDYLYASVQPEISGFKASGELALKLAIDIGDTSPNGFSAALFYP